MGPTLAGVRFAGSLLLALAVAYRPLVEYVHRNVSSTRHLRVERVLYKMVGVDPDGEQSWGVYARSVLAFSAVSILFLYAFLRLQHHLWLSLGFPAVDADGAWNTAVSFVTNTDWQWYSGEVWGRSTSPRSTTCGSTWRSCAASSNRTRRAPGT
jgi:K+-transporting ATPase ATPase A chain